jgi:hypothetical protein
VFGYTLVVSNLVRTPERWPSMGRVPPAERSAMAWIAAHVREGSRFVVASAARRWSEDAVDAWFPALTGRVSVATPNGAEWLPRGEFGRRVQAYGALRGCAQLDAACLDAWSARFGLQFTDVYVSKPDPAPGAPAVPRAALAATDAFVVIYDGPGATVFARRHTHLASVKEQWCHPERSEGSGRGLADLGFPPPRFLVAPLLGMTCLTANWYQALNGAGRPGTSPPGAVAK